MGLVYYLHFNEMKIQIGAAHSFLGYIASSSFLDTFHKKGS
jgi:hypothetical protein